MKDEVFEEIYDDIKQEMEKIGTISRIIIPRPENSEEDEEGRITYPEDTIGKVFIEYDDLGSSFAAFNLMNNKVFNKRPLEITFYEENSFRKLYQ